MPTFLSNPVSKPVLIISGLSYLVSVLISDLLFDLLGNSHFSRTYYCSLKPAVQSDLSRNVPLVLAVMMTATALSLKVSESHKRNSALFIFELSMISAMLLVCIPLYFKLIQLVSIGCSSPDNDPAGPWPVHKNLLMSHMCVLIILGGSAVAQFVTLIHPQQRRSFSRKFKH